MCFSAEVSFATAGALLPVGWYCARIARRHLPRYWAFAVIPFAFAIQQFSEGFVWLGLHHGHESLARIGSGVFLFLALAFWPSWLFVAAVVAERRRILARILWVGLVLSTGWLWFAFLPVLRGLPSSLDAEIAQHSIHYRYADEVVLGSDHRALVTILYILCTAGPFLVTSLRRELGPAVFSGVVITTIAAWSYSHAYTSVWCFAAAILSGYCAFFMYRSTPSGVIRTSNPGDDSEASATPSP